MSLLGRMIPARFVQEHLQAILEAANNDSDACAAVIDAADDMSLLTVDSRDDRGNVTGVTWTDPSDL